MTVKNRTPRKTPPRDKAGRFMLPAEGAPRRRATPDERRREQVERAAEIFVQLFEPAMKELEKH